MKTSTTLLTLGLLLFSLACRKGEITPEEPEIIKHYSSIIAKVNYCNAFLDPFCDSLTPIPGVVIRAYETEEDRFYGEPLVAENVTNGAGEATFGSLERGAYYWFTIRSSQYGEQEAVTSTPTNGVAYLDIIFD